MGIAGRQHPADEGCERGDVDYRRVQPRGPICQAPIACATRLGRFHHAHHLGKEGLAGRCHRLDLQWPRQVEGARL